MLYFNNNFIVFSGLPSCHIRCAQLAYQVSKWRDISCLYVLFKLHWLQGKQHTVFKILFMMFNFLHGWATSFTCDVISVKPQDVTMWVVSAKESYCAIQVSSKEYPGWRTVHSWSVLLKFEPCCHLMPGCLLSAQFIGYFKTLIKAFVSIKTLLLFIMLSLDVVIQLLVFILK